MARPLKKDQAAVAAKRKALPRKKPAKPVRVVEPRPFTLADAVKETRRTSPALDEDVKRFIVAMVAWCRVPADVVARVRERFGIVISPQRVECYDPTKVNGAGLREDLKEFFYRERAEYNRRTAENPAASQDVRVDLLYAMYETALGKGNLKLASSLLEQIAKECGGAYTNKQLVASTVDVTLLTPEQRANEIVQIFANAQNRALAQGVTLSDVSVVEGEVVAAP